MPTAASLSLPQDTKTVAGTADVELTITFKRRSRQCLPLGEFASRCKSDILHAWPGAFHTLHQASCSFRQRRTLTHRGQPREAPQLLGFYPHVHCNFFTICKFAE
ncbi:hypothetical protein ACJQWK_11440 [Exserohilum turcicum]